MTAAGILRACLATGLALALLASPALAGGLSIPSARDRAADFAESTCKHDQSCTGFGVRNCRREGPNIVFCRIVDRRRTEAQGKFVCTRLIRLALNPRTREVPVTGLGPWNC
jgi:hypothetical protein